MQLDADPSQGDSRVHQVRFPRPISLEALPCLHKRLQPSPEVRLLAVRVYSNVVSLTTTGFGKSIRTCGHFGKCRSLKRIPPRLEGDLNAEGTRRLPAGVPVDLGNTVSIKAAALRNLKWITGRTVGQEVLRQFGDVTEVLVARVAEVRRAEAEEHGHRAAVAALVLEVVGSVAGAHLGPGHVAAAAAHQLGGVERFGEPLS